MSDKNLDFFKKKNKNNTTMNKETENIIHLV